MLSLIFAAALQTGLMVCSPNNICISGTASEIDQAKEICDQHTSLTISSVIATNPPIPVPLYSPGWETCDKIFILWSDSETGKAEKAQRDKDAADIEFVKRVARDHK